MDLRYNFFLLPRAGNVSENPFLLRLKERGDVTMKKYYIIYAVIGIVFLMSCGVLFLNPNSQYLNTVFHGPFGEIKEATTTVAGDIAIFAILAVAAIAAIACIVYHVYKFIRGIWLKAHHKKNDEDNRGNIPGIELSQQSFKDLPEFSRLRFRAVGEDFEKMLEEEKDKQNRE